MYPFCKSRLINCRLLKNRIVCFCERRLSCTENWYRPFHLHTNLNLAALNTDIKMRGRKKGKEGDRKTHLSQFNPVTVQRATGCKSANRNPWRTHQVPANGHEPVVKISSVRHTAASTTPKWISNKVFAVCCCCVCGCRGRVWRLRSTASRISGLSFGILTPVGVRNLNFPIVPCNNRNLRASASLRFENPQLSNSFIRDKRKLKKRSEESKPNPRALQRERCCIFNHSVGGK